MDFDITRKKINVFKIGKQYCFKHYFNDKQVFQELSKYYNEEKYRFECNTLDDRNKIIKYLWKVGFDANLVEYLNDYIIKINRTKKYAPILKSSIEQKEIGNNIIFLMKDLASLEQAIEQGAERYTNKIQALF
jgi:hypothetical protein